MKQDSTLQVKPLPRHSVFGTLHILGYTFQMDENHFV